MKTAKTLRRIAALFPTREAFRVLRRRRKLLRKVVRECTDEAYRGKMYMTYWSHEYPDPDMTMEDATVVAERLKAMGYDAKAVSCESSSGSAIGIEVSWEYAK